MSWLITNQERIQKRIERDKARRAEKKREKHRLYNQLPYIFNLESHAESVQKCRKGVIWKSSAQTYVKHEIFNAKKVVNTYSIGNVLPLKKAKTEIIRERGKNREITPIAFSDRVPQRMLCDNSLVPLIGESIIDENCASMPGKGVNYARLNIDKFIGKANKLWGDNYYVLVTDFKSFFDSIPHKSCYNVLDKIYNNKEIVDLLMKIIVSYHITDINHNKELSEEKRKQIIESLNKYNGTGICLGSQVSQMMALLVPNEFDHYIKDKCSMKFYLRYMDDCIVFNNDKEELKELYCGMKQVANMLGLSFNDKKTKIVKITKGFKFLKIHYRVIGKKVIRTLDRTTVIRQRRKLKKFRCLVDKGKMDLDDVYNSMQSWLSHCRYASNCYHSKKAMLKLYNELFDGHKITKQYCKKNNLEGGKLANEILQSYRW